ncbi:flavin reductase [Yinghuangia soli]|uniref:Flavin reductase n=1 Tax=Yinghuangia soli TaxID=2908204 RepID=A0AA41U383_9ACTN|nr:flavin reductase [Yinghuangia soli]MCF2531555.1 flavin reductase [Yinghuangia soli]
MTRDRGSRVAVDGGVFREVLGLWPTGVSIVTTVADGTRHGMTASSVSSVSADPPLISVCVNRSQQTHRLVAGSGVFAVSILGRDQTRLGRVFAGMEPQVRDRFADGLWKTCGTGAPVLADAVAWLDCTVEHAYPGGDHTIFVGRVQSAARGRAVAPLLYHSRSWGQIADPLPESVSVADVGLADALARRWVAPETVEHLTSVVRAAGARTRIDIKSAPPGAPPAQAAHVSALVRDPCDITEALSRGAGIVEISPTGGDATALAARAQEHGLDIVVRVPHAFAVGSADRVRAAVDEALGLGCAELCLEEGSEAASPLHIRTVVQDAVVRARPTPVRVALREHNGLGLANALTAMKSGVRMFDTTLGGVDGRLSTEGLLYLAARLDISSVTDPTAIARAARELENLWGARRPLGPDPDRPDH